MKKILVIEDNSVLLDSITDFLREEGFDIIKGTNGEEGVDLAKEHLPDVILSDIYMPRMNGYQVFDALKSNPSTSLIPFIFISAKSEKEDILYGLKLGADDYIIKPIDFPELLNRILTRIEKTQNTIQLSEIKYQALFETAYDAILMVRLRDGVILDANLAACKLLGYSKEELLTIRGEELFAQEDLQKSVLSEPGSTYWNDFNMVETFWVNKDGSKIPIHVSGKRIQLIGEKYIFLIARDITELKAKEKAIVAAKEKAEESDRLKSSILANMSHELRTPLNGILGFAEILKEQIINPDHSTMVDNIQLSGKWLMSTLDSILLLSQLEGGKIRPVVTETDISVVIREVIASMLPKAAEKELRLTNQAPPNLVINADRKLVFQMIHQLVDNAIKFTIKGGVSIDAWIEITEGQPSAFIEVTDTGIGIAKENIEIVFHEFRQVSEGLSRKFQGSGLGLTICRKILQLIKGTINLESTPGVGSVFTVSFPSAELSVIPQRKHALQKESQAAGGKADQNLPLLLIVEDNLMNRELTTFFLRGICRLDHARDGKTAVQLAGKKQYAAILMDLNLGEDIDGIETARIIRKIPGYEKTPIVALTGYVLTGEEEKNLSDLFSYCLTKPFDKTSIANIVRKTLTRGD